ncbi:hypothetical protein V8D89_005958 [Ganoderma adspersum]
MHPTRPERFSELPPHPTGDAWSAVICEAHQILSSLYSDSAALLCLDDGDPLRLHLHATQILKRKIATCAEALGILVRDLLNKAANANTVLEDNLVKSLPICTVKSGGRGRPQIEIDPAWLKDATSSHRHIPLTSIAKALHIHWNTLRNKMCYHNIDTKFSDISDEDLELLIQAFKLMKPNSSLRYVIGFLKGHGLRIQKTQVPLQNHATIDCREYTVPYSNYLWHIDGYHKLIKWGFVLHGGADISSILTELFQMLMLSANTNNLASTVLELFLKANLEVAMWITKYRGAGRASFMWGSVLFFTCLERRHQLDSSNAAHLWLLHLIFLDELNKDCDEFCSQWNHHPISGKGQDRSPLESSNREYPMTIFMAFTRAFWKHTMVWTAANAIGIPDRQAQATLTQKVSLTRREKQPAAELMRREPVASPIKREK